MIAENIYKELFTGLLITDCPDPELMRCVLELVLFCELERGNYNPNGKELIAAAQCLFRRMRNLSDAHPIADDVERQIQIQASSLFRRLKEARSIEITRLVSHETRKFHFPIAALAPEAKRRIYEYLAKPIRDELRAIKTAEHLAYRDRAISGATALSQDLARRFGVRETVSTSEAVAVLRASHEAAKLKYSELKQKLQCAPPHADSSQLERSVKKAQNLMNEMPAKIQNLLRGDS